jgi:hypothetical protein
MTREFDLYGMFLPPLLVCLAIALPAAAILRRLLEHVRFYRLVWHRPLFDLSLLILVVGAAAVCLSHWSSP